MISNAELFSCVLFLRVFFRLWSQEIFTHTLHNNAQTVVAYRNNPTSCSPTACTISEVLFSAYLVDVSKTGHEDRAVGEPDDMVGIDASLRPDHSDVVFVFLRYYTVVVQACIIEGVRKLLVCRELCLQGEGGFQIFGALVYTAHAIREPCCGSRGSTRSLYMYHRRGNRL